MSDQEPVVAQKSPYEVELEAGQLQFGCACGQSQNQPYCDGSHAGTEFRPEKIEIVATRRVALCQCKMTEKSPYCDGTHSRLD